MPSFLLFLRAVVLIICLIMSYAGCSSTHCEQYYAEHQDSVAVRDYFGNVELSVAIPFPTHPEDTYLGAELYIDYDKLNQPRFDSLQFRGSFANIEEWKHKKILAEWEDQRQCYERYCELEIRWKASGEFEKALDSASTMNEKRWSFRFPSNPGGKREVDSLEVRLRINQGQITSGKDSIVTKVYHLHRFTRCWESHPRGLGGC